MDGRGLASSVPPPPTRPRGTDGVFGRFSIGFTAITVLPYSELDAEPLGVLEFLFKYIFFIDVLLGLEVYMPRVADGMAPLTEEEEEAWWEQWEKEMEREEEEERRRKLEEEEEGRQKEEEEDYKGIDYWREEEEEEDVEVEEEVEEDKEAVAREQERFLQWVEEWVEEKVGVEDGRPCVQRFVCEYFYKHTYSSSSSSSSSSASSSSSSSSSSEHPSLLSHLVHILFVPQETHGGAILEQYRAAKRIGGQAAAGGTSRSCGGAFPSCPLSVFNALGGYF